MSEKAAEPQAQRTQRRSSGYGADEFMAIPNNMVIAIRDNTYIVWNLKDNQHIATFNFKPRISSPETTYKSYEYPGNLE